MSSLLAGEVTPMWFPQHSLTSFNYQPRCILPFILSNGLNKEARQPFSNKLELIAFLVVLYCGEVLCNVRPVNVCHLLLGRP